MARNRFRRLLSALMTFALLLSSFPAMAVNDYSNCNHEWIKEIDYTGEMCGSPYYVSSVCKHCGLYNENVPTVEKYLEHKFGDWHVVRKATCLKTGLSERKCGVCGLTETRKSDKTNHKWGAWQLVTPPGEYTVGKEKRVCSVCGADDWRNIYPDGTLRRGDRGDDVQALQEDLNDAGYDCGKPDGIFGPKTEDAVKQYEKDHDFPQDGIAWPGIIAGLQSDADPSSAFELYIRSNIDPIPAVQGDTVVVTLGMKNVGETLLTLFMHEVKDKDGNSRSGLGTDEIIGEWPLALSQFAPGEAESVKLSIQVTEQDILNGSIIRTYTQYGKIWRWDDSGTLRPARPADVGKSSYLTTNEGVLYELAESVTITIPLLTAGWNVPADAVRLMKGVLDEPSNGQFYVEGEQITYMIMLENNSANALTDVEVSDPLKGGNEDAILTLGETVNGGETKEWEFTYTVTAEDVERGHIDNTAYANYTQGDDYFDISSNTFTVPTGVEVAEHELYLEVIEFADAAYAPGEELPGKLRVTNTGAKPLYLYAYRFSSGDASTMFDTIRDFDSMAILLHPEQSAEFDFVVYASEGDFTVFNEVIRHIEMYGVPYAGNGESDMDTKVVSNTVEVNAPAYYEVPETLVSIVKKEISTPNNDAYYVEGETIRYEISFTNNSAEELNGVLIYDILDESGEATGIAHQFMPGEERSIAFEYTVTALDVAVGEVVNYAILTYPQAESTVQVYSNIVTSLTGMSGFGVIEELFIDKKEVSTPGNGSYYQEGETISYEITFNNVGETMLGETVFYDSLAVGGIGYAEHLYPGEQRSVKFDYVVTARDVEAGCVVNYAMAEYESFGFQRTVQSNGVCSPTSAEMKTEPTAPAIELPVIKGGDSDGGGNNGDFCVRTIEARNNAENHFTLHYCTTHGATLQAVQAMVDAAETAQAKATAWEYGISLWQSDLAEMYTVLMNAVNSSAKAIVLREQLRFNAVIVNRRVMLEKLYPDAPERMAEILAGMYADQCLEMCYLLHTAPEYRKDDLLLVPSGDGMKDACATIHTPVDATDFSEDECFCESHRTTNVMSETLLAYGGTEEAWNWVETIWNAEMTKEYKNLKARSAEDAAELIASDAQTYSAWNDARREILQLLYPEKAEIAAQLSARAVTNRVQELCSEK